MIKKKLTIVIGGTKGIGKTITQTLRKRGDNVITISRNRKIKNNISLDLSCDKEEIKKILSNYLNKRKIKKVDNIIFSQRYRGTEIDLDYKISLHSTRDIVEILIDKLNINGSVVFISSIAIQTIVHDQNVDYHITRSGIELMTKYYAVKYGHKKIRFNCILPTKIIKPENKKFFTKDNKITKLIQKITPLNRMGDSQDIANVCDFLTCYKSSFLTGVTIPVDGGARLQSHEGLANILM